MAEPAAQSAGPNEFRDPLIRTEIKRAAVWVGMVAGLALMVVLAQPLLLIFGAIVLAAGLDGGTRLLGRVLPIGRGWRLGLILVTMVLLLGWLLVSAGDQLVAQAATLQATLTVQVERLLAIARANGLADLQFDPTGLVSYAAGSVGQAAAIVSSVVGGLTALFLMFILGMYIAIEPRLYQRGVAWLVPLSGRDHFHQVAAAMGFTMRRLIAGRLLGMVIEGVATWAMLAAYGIPMAALLGIITGLLVFIPNIGALISGILMVLVGFSVGVDAGLYTIFVYFVVQTVDGNIIVPMIAKRTVDLAPALVLGAQVIFGALFGLLGLALADPAVAMIKVFLEKNAARKARGDHAPVAPPANSPPAAAAAADQGAL